MFYTKFMDLCEKSEKKHYTVLKELNIPTGTLSVWKKGSTPNVYTCYDIAKYFGCRIEDLIEREYL